MIVKAYHASISGQFVGLHSRTSLLGTYLRAYRPQMAHDPGHVPIHTVLHPRRSGGEHPNRTHRTLP